MAIRTPVSLDQAAPFLAEFGLAPPFALRGIERGTVNTSFAVSTGSGTVFLRLYEEQDAPGAEEEARRLAYLAQRGVRTPAPMPTRDGRLLGSLAGKPAALFPWRDGDMRCLSSVTPADTAAVGQALAALHLAGVGAPRGPGRFEPPDLRSRLERIRGCGSVLLAREAERLGERLEHWCRCRDTSLPRGLIHGDLFRDNVLFLPSGELSALLDFESASDGVLAYDLMVTILAWCYRDAFEPELAAALTGGYVKTRPLSRGERDGLQAEAAIAAIRFTVTRITDEAMRALALGRAERPDKDWRRFAARLAALESLDRSALRGLLSA